MNWLTHLPLIITLLITIQYLLSHLSFLFLAVCQVLTFAPNKKTSAQGAKFAVKPTFSVSYGYTGSKYAHTTNCSPQKQKIHGEALTSRLTTKTSWVLQVISETFKAPQQFQFRRFHKNGKNEKVKISL